MSTTTLDRVVVERLVRQALARHLGGNGHADGRAAPRLVVNISARHCHVTQEDLERLFGKGHRLRVYKPLYQDGFFAAEEALTINRTRPRMIPNLSILCPCAGHTQVRR